MNERMQNVRIRITLKLKAHKFSSQVHISRNIKFKQEI